VIHNDWDSQVCGSFFFISVLLLQNMFNMMIMTFSYILMCSDILYGGYKPIHH
jgi:hypothetical protein